MKKLILPVLLMCISTFTFAQNVNITFELNVATLGTDLDAAGPFVAGGTAFGFPGDHPMTDPDNDGIYTVTISQPVGTSSHFTFLNGACGDWSCKENVAGLPCADPNNYNDRFLPPVTQDTTIQACFGQCTSDGSCVIVTDSVDVTFMVNTASIATIDPAGIFMAGGGNFGNPGDNAMTDSDNDGTYEITVRLPKGLVSFYTFTNGACGDWSCKEDLDGLPCGDPDNFNDRFFAGAYSDTTLMHCFGQCSTDGSCATNTNGLLIDNSLFTLQPTVVNNYALVNFGDDVTNTEKQVTIVNSMGQVMLSTTINNVNQYRIDATNYSNGIYFIMISTNETRSTQKFMVTK